MCLLVVFRNYKENKYWKLKKPTQAKTRKKMKQKKLKARFLCTIGKFGDNVEEHC